MLSLSLFGLRYFYGLYLQRGVRMNKSKSQGTVLHITDKQLEWTLYDRARGLGDEIPHGLVGRYIMMVVLGAREQSNENAISWAKELNEHDREQGESANGPRNEGG